MAKVALTLILIIAVVLLLTWYRAYSHRMRAQTQYPPEGRIIVVDGKSVHAVVLGKGPDLVLIHGASGNTRDFTHALAEKLAGSYRVLVFDRPGLGYSDAIGSNGASIELQAAHLVQAARQLGAQKPIVLGQSYGGAVALAWAVNHPKHISALVPVAAASNPWSTPLDMFYQITSHPILGPIACWALGAWVPDKKVIEALDEIFAPQNPPETFNDHIGAGLTLRPKSMRENALQRANLKSEIASLHHRYGKISVPTEIIHGDADTIVSIHIHSEKLVNQISGAVLTPLAGVGHMPHHTNAHDVIAAVNRAAARAGLR